MDHASKRVSPNSTYKIYDALLGLESGIITPEHYTFTWNGEPYPFNSWEADQDLTSAIHNSVKRTGRISGKQQGFFYCLDIFTVKMKIILIEIL